MSLADRVTDKRSGIDRPAGRNSDGTPTAPEFEKAGDIVKLAREEPSIWLGGVCLPELPGESSFLKSACQSTAALKPLIESVRGRFPAVLAGFSPGPLWAQDARLGEPAVYYLSLLFLSVLVVALMLANRRLARLRAQVRQEAERNERLVAGLPVGVYELVDRASMSPRFDFVSDRAVELFGVGRAQLLADFQAVFSHFHRDDVERIMALNERARQAGVGFEASARIVSNGRTRWVLIQSEPRQVGKDRRWGGIISDITDQKKTEAALTEAEQRFQAMLEQAPIGILLHDAQSGSILDGNREAWRSFGADSLAGLAEHQSEIWAEPPYDWNGALARIHQARDHGRQQFDWLSRRLDGSQFWMQVTLTSIRIDDRDCVLAACIDVTLRREAERLLRESDKRFRTLLRDVPGVAIQGYGLDGRVLYWNRASEQLYGYSEAEALKSSLIDLIIPPEQRAAVHESLRAVAAGGSIDNGELELMRKDGSRVTVYSSHSVLRRRGLPTELFCLDIDLSEQKRHEDELIRIANFDGLTDLPNRKLLAERMREQCARADRNRNRLAVCYLDLDEFKPINDRYGHGVGDRVLTEIADRLRGLVRQSDVVARLGGDEFVLLLEGFSDTTDLERRLNAVLERIGQPMIIDSHKLQVLASIGVTLYPDDASDPDTLLRHADQAMYRAKAQGRNGFSLFDIGMEEEFQQRRDRLLEIRAGLEGEQFELFYHPKIDLRSGAVIGVEGLVRWRHPERGVLVPASFLGDLDRSDLEGRFGSYVIEQALGQLERWLAQGLVLPVSVNLSGPHLLSPGFVDQLKELMARHPRVTPGLLQVEILESAALADLDRATAVLDQIRRIGLQVSLDDFGTGYSSLSHLRSLPVDEVKIDQSFVRRMLTNLSDYSIVRSVISLANAFGLRVVAEGVETLDHMAALTELDCELAQGYAFAHPMVAEDLPAWLRQWGVRAASIEWGEARLNDHGSTLSIAVNTHRNWLRRIHEVVRGQRRPDPDLSAEDARCVLGRWLDEEGRQRYGHLAAYGVTKERHARVHQIAARVLELAGSAPEQWLKPLSDLDSASEELIRSLQELRTSDQSSSTSS